MYCKPYALNAGAGPGVPLRLKAEKSAAGNDLAERSSVAEVYTQILEDLNAAEPLAILTYADDLLSTTRIHRNTIIALKQGFTWQKAIGQMLYQNQLKWFPQTLLLWHHQVLPML